MYAKCQYVRSVTKMSFVTQILQNQLTASGSGTVSALPTCHAKSRLFQTGPGFSLVVCETSCWGRATTRDGVFLSKLSFRPAGRWPSPHGLPASSMGPESRFVSLPLEGDEKYCIFQPRKPKISGFSPSLSVPGCGRANSHWRPPADGSAASPLARAVVTKDKGMCRFQFWRPEAGPPGASRLALCRKDAPRPPARAGRWLPPSVPACGFVRTFLRRAPVTLD